MAPDSPDELISGPEAEAQLRFVERALHAADDAEQRRAVLVDGLLAFGDRFVTVWGELAERAGGEGFFQETANEVRVLLVAWMKGQDLTSRADEADRRALAALRLLDARPDLRNLFHYAAQAILALPPGHALRDVDKARAAVRSQLLDYQTLGDDTPWVFAAYALSLAYDQRFGSDEELTAWEPWAETIGGHLEPADALRLWGSLESYFLDRADADGAQWREHAVRARAHIDAASYLPEDAALSELMRMAAAVAGDDQLQAAEHMRKALESGSFRPRVQRMIAVKEARVRLAHQDFERVVELLEPRLAGFEEDYVTAILDKARTDAGEDHQEACTSLAYALSRLGRWERAVEALERGKCARQRYTRALRRTPAAAQLLELEADLYAMARRLPIDRTTPSVARVEDWLAHGISPESALQEQYRQAIPTLDAAAWKAPHVADMQRALGEGEAVLSLALSWPGLLGALIGRDREDCLLTISRPDVTEASLTDHLASMVEESGQDGFLIALERATDIAAQRASVERLLAFLDEAIGKPVAEAMTQHGLSRLVVIPHRFLRLTPLWALPSWQDVIVRLVPDASSLTLASTGTALARRALVISNPTLDLPMAPTEGSVASARLGDAGFEVRTLDGSAATEDAVAERLPGVGLLHFAGHGHASLTDGSLSALLVSAEWARAELPGPEGLIAMANQASATPHLKIDQDEGSPRRKIYFDYAKRGTLFADATDDTIAVAGELWRAGDILVQGSLEGCGLAFLCACSSGLGALDALDEGTGLPAALDLAGVRSVVSTGWPVQDELALLFADEFYARLLPEGKPGGDVAAAVHGAAAAIRAMDREQAVSRIEALAARATDAAARFRLRAYAKRLRSGAERPFTHPFDWGAFHVMGAGRLNVPEVA